MRAMCKAEGSLVCRPAVIQQSTVLIRRAEILCRTADTLHAAARAELGRAVRDRRQISDAITQWLGSPVFDPGHPFSET